MKKENLKIVKEYLDENPNINDTDLADLILEDRVVDKSHRTIRRYIIEIRGSSFSESRKLDSNTLTLDDTPIILSKITLDIEPYTIVGNNYNIKYNKELLEVDIKTVNSIFCSYSKKGLNYSGPFIMSVLEIDKKIFNAIVSKLDLSKDSELLGPHTMESLTALNRRDTISSLTSELLEKYAQADSGVAESIVKEFKKKYVDLVFNSNQKNEIYAHIIDKLPQVKVSKYDAFEESNNNLPLYVVIGDMHIGLEVDGFNVGHARHALTEMSTKINTLVEDKNYTDVYLLFLGDIPHTISGINHANMWKDIEPGLWGAEAIIKPYELLVEFIHNTHNITKIYAVGGNHGRLHSNRDLEPTDEGEKLIFYMIQNTFINDLKVIWDPDKVIFTKSNLTFIILHGDQGQDKKSGQDIAWNLGQNGTYNLILVGHTHSRQINKNDDGIGYRKMVCPAFCPTDSYAERLGYNSLPGFLLITEDNHGFPIVSDHPIYYPKK